LIRQIILSSLQPCLACSYVPGRQDEACLEQGLFSHAACLECQIVMSKILVSIFLFITFIPGTAHATTQSAEEVVKITLDQVIEKLSSENGNLEVHPESAFELIQKQVVPHFDFPNMSRWILGKNWNKASQSQRQAFIHEFRILMVGTYVKTLKKYSVKEIRYFPVQNGTNSNLAIVNLEIWTHSSTHTIGSANTVLIKYKMHISNSVWKVIDITVDGISLVRSYRRLFASQIRKNGFDSLIIKLTERNSKLEDHNIRVSQN